MTILERLQRLVQKQYIKRAIAFYTATQVTLLIAIATIWVLAISEDDSPALTWGLWRIPDVVLPILSAAIWVLVDSIVSDAKPGIIVYIIGAIVTILDIASLVWFGISYRECINFFDCTAAASVAGDCTNTDPLCTVGNFDSVTLYYLVLTSILGFVNLTYTLLIGTILVMLTMTIAGLNTNAYTSRYDTMVMDKERRRAQRFRYLQWYINFLTIGWVFIVVEFCVLAEESTVKYYLFVHIPHIVCVVQTFLPLGNYTTQKIGIAFAFISAVASGVGGLLVSILYYTWNCSNEIDPTTMFANTHGCELGIPGSRYFIAINVFAVAVALLRLPLYGGTMSILRTFTTRTIETSSTKHMFEEGGEMSYSGAEQPRRKSVESTHQFMFEKEGYLSRQTRLKNMMFTWSSQENDMDM